MVCVISQTWLENRNAFLNLVIRLIIYKIIPRLFVVQITYRALYSCKRRPHPFLILWPMLQPWKIPGKALSENIHENPTLVHHFPLYFLINTTSPFAGFHDFSIFFLSLTLTSKWSTKAFSYLSLNLLLTPNVKHTLACLSFFF